MHTLHLGDCRDVLATMGDATVDAIVCDPPYELGFMGKAWDASGIAYDVTVWTQCLRVLKPGGHLIAFGGSRTYHRLAVAIEDAGFEIRDQIQWIYGSGFPKSLDVSKAMDKQRHDRSQVLEVTAWIRSARDASGLSNAQIDAAFGFAGMAGHWTSSLSQPSVPTLDQIPVLLDLFDMTLNDVPYDVRTLIWTLNGRKGQPGEAWHQREVITEKRTDMFGEYEVEDVRTMVNPKEARLGMPLQKNANHQVAITAPSTDLAKQWHGWGTALKPAHEPAVLARKPLRGTVADTVAQWGTGALNIEGTRITDAGRWPSNVILDEEAASLLGEPSRFFYVAKASKAEREAGLDGVEAVRSADRIKDDGVGGDNPRNRSNQPRANHHPTVKPLALMRYLVRMVTPPGGVVLDPFMGSGSTGCAAVREGFDFVGIDLTPEYVAIAQKRIDWHAVSSPLDNLATMESHEEERNA